ncbi:MULTISPECIES: hypothetical protein [unclassified Facklamia]|uniref:hypothetical protein n=1 Tax=Aerococcaceae TaxID=186827 RepID=UPI0013B9F5F6|nr:MULTISPECIES: hypothetical protein [unclassified Facklamia]MBS4462824.1 hypothetical protein [Aerococcaceae bacterium zg-B36]NEW65273.1 hypothetical protein [Facklamia sp. 252]NEW68747.1 hypothetical protein [Facklamia sp. 253]QQD66135.1 hypothetical protein JDW14_03245 [Aerococcaceae bacterium zg-252]
MATRTLGTQKEILHNLPFEALSVTVDKSTTGTKTINGRKMLLAGTIVAGDGVSVFENRAKKVKTVTTPATAERIDGILLHDVDVTEGDATASMVFRGTVREDKIGNGTVDANVKTKLPHIVFIKGA